MQVGAATRRSRRGRPLSPLDGRIERSRRTRQALVDAFLPLAGRLGRLPTAQELSAETGRSSRVLFDRFPSLDALATEAVRQLLAPSPHEMLHNVAGLDRADRIAFHAERRGRQCERWMPAWPVAMQVVRRDRECAALLDALARQERRLAEALYAPEMRLLDEAERDRRLLTLDILLGIDTWIRLRAWHGLSMRDALGFWRNAIAGLL